MGDNVSNLERASGEGPQSAIGLLRRAGALDPSPAAAGNGAVAVRAGGTGWELLAWSPSGSPPQHGIDGTATELAGGTLLVASPSHANAAALRELVPWLRPGLMGASTTAGTGDRLGVATPGQAAAFGANPGIFPIFAQQSARELMRSGRTFRDVVDAATLGVLAAGWRTGYGADADHLKSIADIDAGIAAGCTMFTADPIELVPDLPADAPAAAIAAAYASVPWAELEDDPVAFAARYPKVLDLDSGPLDLPPDAIRAAAARFGRAVVQVAAMYRHLVGRLDRASVDFEVAVDEIEYRTTPVDHVYIATELSRLGVRWVSLAPRFVGDFEKGIDYLGDRVEFEADVALHAAIARRFGDYRLSVHSGSDKFSIYEAIARATRDRVHLKTSGTSYLVALETVAALDPTLMRRVWGVALEAYTTARASYHVSATVTGAPSPDGATVEQLVGLLHDPNTREILHVTYGSVLNGPAAAGTSGVGLGDEFRAAIWAARETYWANLADHIGRHLRPFAEATGQGLHEGVSR
jgi:tagaturonate epimerase